MGHGFVGSAVASYFKANGVDVVIHDPGKEMFYLNAVCQQPIIFVAVPTPQSDTGECDTSILDEALLSISATSTIRPVVVIKSTVPVGYTRRAAARLTNLRLVFCPEFLTEKNAAEDFATGPRLVLSGADADMDTVEKLFTDADMRRFTTKTIILRMSYEEAELAKLASNATLMAKVIVANEIYQLCQKLNISYRAVRSVVATDPRIGSSHLSVPGHDGFYGAGGTCFPKDIENLRSLYREHGVTEKVFTAVSKRNVELRPDVKAAD